MREHRHLFLRGEYHVDVRPGGDVEHAIEPDQGRLPEIGDTVQRADVAGEAGQAQRIGDRGGDVVSQLVQPVATCRDVRPAPSVSRMRTA